MFDEEAYLSHYPDVARAVQNGLFRSGREHYDMYGRNEGRKVPGVSSEKISAEATPSTTIDYWEERRESEYISHIISLVKFIGKDAKRMIDVGSNGCPYIELFDWADYRVSVDLAKPYGSDKVVPYKGDFLTYEPDRKFDLCLCLQVLEHIPDATAFARKLLSISSRVLVSVPYRWPITEQTAPMGHIHDPVDEEKMLQWFGREPDLSMISTEPGTRIRRLICLFES